MNCLKKVTKILRLDGTKDYRKSGFGKILQRLHIVTDHSPLTTHNSLKKTAFTLAEVLIALTVIGVVAAITLPPMIHNYQKHVWVNQLKKDYSMFSNGFKKMLADDEVNDLSQTKVFSSIGTNASCTYTTPINSAQCVDFYENLKKYFDIARVYGYRELTNYSISYLDGSNQNPYQYLAIALKSGELIIQYSFKSNPTLNASNLYSSCDAMKQSGGKLCYTQGGIVIDVNGKKGPNKWGRDIFKFLFSSEGDLYPYGGKDAAISILASALTWNTYYNYCGRNDTTFTEPVTGVGCAARVIASGWKMEY